MATYYKYVERNAKDRINWNEVGKSVSDMLNEEAKVRLDKKAEIDENSRQFGIELANAPVGDYDHGNTFINEYTTNMSEYRRMQDNLLKSGQLNLGDYARNRQNNTDGTKLTFDLATAYQEAYTEKMDRWKSSDYKNKSQYREIYEMESVEGLANMRTTGSFINPTNGVISLATRDKNGGLDMNNTRTAAEMYGSIKRKYDAYDVNAAVKSEVDYLGDFVFSEVQEAINSRGLSSVSQLTDQKEAPGYQIWEDDTISSMMADTDHITSILTNNVLQTDKGEKFTYTDNETDFINDKSGTLIYLDKSVDAAGKPVFKPEQETVVKDFLRNRIQQQIDVKLDIATAGYKPQRTPKTPPPPGGSPTEVVDMSFNMLKDIYYGDKEQVAAAEQYFRDNIDGAVKVFKNKDIIEVYFKDGSMRPVTMLDTKGQVIMPFDTFAQSATLLTGVSNIAEAVDLAGGVQYGEVISVKAAKDPLFKKVTFKDGRTELRRATEDIKVGTTIQLGSQVGTGKGASTTYAEDPKTNLELAVDYVRKNILLDLFNNTTPNDDDVQEKLKAILQPFGFEVTLPTDPRSVIKLKKTVDGVTEESGKIFTNKDNPAEAQASMNEVIRFVTGLINEADADAKEVFLKGQVGMDKYNKKE